MSVDTLPMDRPCHKEYAWRRMKISEWLNLRTFAVLCASFFLMLMESGIRQTMNVFTADMSQMLNCSQFDARMIVVVVPNGASLLTGPIASAFYNYFGARIAICAGSLITIAGFLSAAALVTSIYHMIVCSIAIGIGCGMIRNATISVHFEYFPVQVRNVTLSLICIGPGLGIFIFPRAFKFALEVLSWRQVFVGIAVLYGLCAIIGLFIAKQITSKRTLSQVFGLAIWRHPGFIANEFAAFCASTTMMIYVSRTLDWMRAEGVRDEELLYSWNGVASIVGRVVLTCLLAAKVPVGLLMVFSYVVGQFAVSGAGLCTGDLCFGAQNALVGVGSGFYQACLSPYLMYYLGPELLSTAFGFTNLINGAAALFSIFFAKTVVDLFGGGRNVEFVFLLVVGSLSCVAACISYFYFRRWPRPGDLVVKQQVDEPLEQGQKVPEQQSRLLADAVVIRHRPTDSEDLRDAVREYIRKCTLDEPPRTLHEYANDMGRPMDEETHRRLTGTSEE